MDSNISTNIAMIKEVLAAIESDGVEHQVAIQEQIRDVRNSLTRSLQTFPTQGFTELDTRSIAEAMLYAALAFENLVRAEVPDQEHHEEATKNLCMSIRRMEQWFASRHVND